MMNEELNHRDASFEERLQQVAPREIPSAWRKEILAAAKAAQPASHSSNSARPDFLSTLIHQLSNSLQPHRAAWGSLAAVWLVILALNLAARDNSATAQTTTSLSPQTLAAWFAQRRELAALTGLNPPREAEAPKSRPPQPRSNRRAETITV